MPPRTIPAPRGPLAGPALPLLLASLGLLLRACSSAHICVVGAGVGGASLAYFLRGDSQEQHDVTIFEKAASAGGRTRVVEIDGELFEAGASIAHDRNVLLAGLADQMGLQRVRVQGGGYGVWDGRAFVARQFDARGWAWPLASLWNLLSFAVKYGGYNLQVMGKFVQELLDRWMRFYDESLPPFASPGEMLAHVGLLPLSAVTLRQALTSAGVTDVIISDIVTSIIRIQYGQSADITALPGAVGLAGTGSTLWQVKGGNFQLANKLARASGAVLSLNSTVVAVQTAPVEAAEEDAGGEQGAKSPGYAVRLVDGSSRACDAVALAVPLQESGIVLPERARGQLPQLRPYHHTHTTFVKGLLNESYFGAWPLLGVPEMIGTTESPDIPFSSISRQRSKEAEGWAVYKVFSRAPLSEDTLGALFQKVVSVLHIDWAAYPSYQAPEEFVPFLLDDGHLYYINAFEDAASAMEAVAVAAKNVAKVMLSRLGTKLKPSQADLEQETKATHDEL